LLAGVGSFARSEELATLVENAIAEEVAACDEIEERWKKKKLKAGESVLLFGKKTLKPAEQAERMKELREQTGRGEVSFRMLSLAIDDIKIGQAGVIAPKFQPIECRSASDSENGNEFFGVVAVK